MVGFLAVCTLVGAGLGLLFLFGTLAAGGAPQQAALAAIACALSIIPYVVYRLSEDARRERNDRARNDQLLAAIAELRKVSEQLLAQAKQ